MDVKVNRLVMKQLGVFNGAQQTVLTTNVVEHHNQEYLYMIAMCLF